MLFVSYIQCYLSTDVQYDIAVSQTEILFIDPGMFAVAVNAIASQQSQPSILAGKVLVSSQI